VVGGSLGAQTLNDLVLAALKAMPEPSARRSCTRRAPSCTRSSPRDYRDGRRRGRSDPFIDDMAARYSWCDVLVCRSGAVTVARFPPPASRPSSFVAVVRRDEQLANAASSPRPRRRHDAAQLRRSPRPRPTILRGLTRERLMEIAGKARALGKPGATAACGHRLRGALPCGIR
jgi:UDP-N-acetylglucosamine--N-acetylmuramyl-(pentapeptide) pyrophosphoryl-undecaprenol N-acetylglucosamine transferase